MPIPCPGLMSSWTSFTKLDLTKNNWQFPFSAESKDKAAFSTPYGLYQLSQPFSSNSWTGCCLHMVHMWPPTKMTVSFYQDCSWWLQSWWPWGRQGSRPTKKSVRLDAGRYSIWCTSWEEGRPALRWLKQHPLHPAYIPRPKKSSLLLLSHLLTLCLDNAPPVEGVVGGAVVSGEADPLTWPHRV